MPHYLSAKEKARLAAEAAEEAARAKANAANDMTARALKQMMNGTPTGNVGPANQAKLTQPAWMKGDSSTFTAEQQQEVIFPLSALQCSTMSGNTGGSVDGSCTCP